MKSVYKECGILMIPWHKDIHICIYKLLQESSLVLLTPLMVLVPRVTLKDLRNLNFSLFCKVFLKLRKFTNHMITAAETWYFCLANPFIFSLRGWQPWQSVSFLTILQLEWHCYNATTNVSSYKSTNFNTVIKVLWVSTKLIHDIIMWPTHNCRSTVTWHSTFID